MSDKPSNHELDDEQLSAYLDGELSADERAAVEARLATDPAAQQLLHELRSVSQSVQALPTESLGRDLSEDIIRRARVVRGSPDPAHDSDRRSPAKAEKETFGLTSGEVGRPAPNSPRSVDSIPKIRIFNSRRAWIWAAMTLAAGVLVMIVQSGDESAKKLPPVAARDRGEIQNQPTDELDKSRRREISMSAPSQSPSPATVASDGEDHKKVGTLGDAIPAAPMAGEAGGGGFGGTTRNGAPTASPVAAASSTPKPLKEDEKTVSRTDGVSNTVTALPSQMATDKSVAATPPSGQISSSGVALGMAAERQKSESLVNPITQRFVVVRVVAKPDALKNGSFDRLLADNKIEFVPEPAKNQPAGFNGGKLLNAAKSESAGKEQQSNKLGDNHAVDMVLVEAPAPAIVSCLADLNKNANDFVSIDVREESPSHDRFDVKLTPVKKLAEETGKNLTRFSRGNVPVAQKDFDPRLYFFSYELAKPNEPTPSDLPRAGGAGPGGPGAADLPAFKHDANGSLALDDQSQPAPGIRRARGIETPDAANRKLGEPASRRLSLPTSAGGPIAPTQSGASGQAEKQPMAQRKPSEEAEAKADAQDNNNWKVLFVFTSEEAPASSAPSDNRTK
jgi:hypothetical protein